MPTECDECGKEVYAVHITRKYKKICGDCYDKIRTDKEWEPDDLTHRIREH